MHGVYLIDDDHYIIEDLKQTVPWLDNGFEVIGSQTDPQKAIFEIEKLQPEVIFSDLRMPGLSGVELLSSLRSKQITAEIVMLSAYGTFQDAKKFFLSGGFDYLLKPVNIDEIEMLLKKISKKLSAGTQSGTDLEKTTGSEAFDGLIQYVKNNYTKKMTLDYLSNLFHISPNYICNLFARHYGTTLTLFITELRMHEAARLVKTTTKAFKEIAICCGYSDYFYFCKVFKDYYGMPPGKYREDFSALF